VPEETFGDTGRSSLEEDGSLEEEGSFGL